MSVNCCKDDCDCPDEPTEPPGGPDPEPVDPCTSETNLFVNGHTYTFSQYGINRKGVHQVYLGTSAINENDNDFAD